MQDERALSRKEQVETEVRQLAEEIAGAQHTTIYDLVFAPAGPRWKLQVFLDRVGDRTANIDDCVAFSRQLSRELDVMDVVPSAYDLEVSTPGMERLLRRPEHWETAVGDKVKVKFRGSAGNVNTVIGVVESVATDAATLRTDDDASLEVPWVSVLKARVHMDW